MIEKSILLDGVQGSTLHVMSWKGEESSSKVIHILHGMAEHGARYKDFAQFLVENGYTVYAHDHRKHGKSLAKGQTIGIMDKNDGFLNIIEDIRVVQDYIKEKENGAEILLLGHSMGSLICRRYLQEHGSYISKAIIMGTMGAQPFLLKGGIAIGKFIRIFVPKGSRSNFLNNLVVGGFNAFFEPTRTPFDWISSDEKQVDKYIADDLCGYSYSSTFYINLFNEVLISQKKENVLRTPQIPLLFVSGSLDPVGLNGVGVKKVYDLYKDLGYENQLSIKLFDDLRHEILNETKNQEVYQYVLDWINSL